MDIKGRNGIYILNRLEDEPEDEPDDEPKVKKEGEDHGKE